MYITDPSEIAYLYLNTWSPHHYQQLPLPTCVRAEWLQSRSTLCDPMDCSPSASSVHGILQARILEWVEGCYAILQGTFGTQGCKLHLLHLLHWQADSLPIIHLEASSYTIFILAQLSHSVVSDSLQPHEPQHTRLLSS